MRRLVLSLLAASSFMTPAFADGAPVFSRPATEANLRKLDNEQLRIVRRAVQTCPTVTAGTSIIRPERNPCVISATDKAVADEHDADLQSFHNALRQTDRYDENRTSASWMVWLARN